MPPPAKRNKKQVAASAAKKKYGHARRQAQMAAIQRRKQKAAQRRPMVIVKRPTTLIKRPANLNERISVPRPTVFLRRASLSMKIAFHPEEIVSLILKMIRSQETRSIVGCVAWLSHKDILKALAAKPCSIVVARDKANARKHVKNMYAVLTPANGNRAIKFLGSRSGRQKFLLHHKFLVAIDSEGVAQKVISGSFNFSQNALNNLENITYIRDSDVAQSYFEEFNRIWDIC